MPGSDTLSLNLLMSCEKLQLVPDYCYNTITVHEVMVISDGHPAFTVAFSGVDGGNLRKLNTGALLPSRLPRYEAKCVQRF